jgi:hypothetical protein
MSGMSYVVLQLQVHISVNKYGNISDAHDAHIKYDLSILDPMLFT